MYIVAIAWLYVVLMMSVTETSVVAGIMTFIFYGVLPLAVVLYVMGGPARWRRIRAAQRASLPDQAEAVETADAANPPKP
jgi:bacteriorhodopsin